MSKATRLASLEKSHAKLDSQIAAAMRQPGFDQITITQMKRQKLVLKDQMAALRS